MRNRLLSAFTVALAIAGSGWCCASPRADENASPVASDRGTFVLVYDATLKDVAIDWAAYRAEDGWRVILQPVDDHANSDPKAVREMIRAHWRLAKPAQASEFVALILGDAPSENEPAPRGVPAWRFRQTDSDMRLPGDDSYVSDHPYQLMDDVDDVADIPLGRVPARTNEHARTVLRKIEAFEQAQSHPHKSGAARVTYVAGEGHYGMMDSVLESMFKTMVDQLVPPEFEVSMTYAKATSPYCPPPSQLADTVLARLSEGCVLFNYVGHGFERGFDALHWNGATLPILRTSDIARLAQHCDPEAQRPIALLTCCSTGWYDLPGETLSISESLLFDPCGPVAVIAGSRVTHPYANIIVQKDVTTLMLHDRVETVGMIDLIAGRSMVVIDEDDRQIDSLAAPVALAGRWQTSLSDLRRMHVRLYNLLGDPATRISLQPPGVQQFNIQGSILTAHVPGMSKGEAKITVEAPRTSFAQPDQLLPVSDPNDPHLESKAAKNYVIANNRVVFRTTSQVLDGRINVPLADAPALGPGMIVRIQASGVDTHGNALSASGALKCTPPVAATVN